MFHNRFALYYLIDNIDLKLKDMTIQALPVQSPRAWEDFIIFYTKLEKENGLIQPLEFLNLPFEMQFGVFVSYFNDNGLDVDIQNWNIELLKTTICETFNLHENMMSHYS